MNTNNLEHYEKYLHERFIVKNKVKPIFSISGGTDSALALYLTCEFIADNFLTEKVIIKPTHGYDMYRKIANSKIAADAVIDHIKNLFPNINIESTHHFSYTKMHPENKSQYHNPQYEYLHSIGFDKEVISGITSKPESFPSPASDDLRSGEYSNPGIIRSYDKRWVALMYKEKNLDELLSKTVSCIADYLEPCKKCWWCKEKYWAFGKY